MRNRKTFLKMGLFVLGLVAVVPSLSLASARCEAVFSFGANSVTAATFKDSIDRFFDHNKGRLQAKNAHLVQAVMSKEAVVQVLRDIMTDPKRLADSASLSYTHSLGFKKITLLHDWDHRGWDLRLHIWNLENTSNVAVPFAEGRHEHRWDFASKLLLGEFENHRYTKRDVNLAEAQAFAKFSKAVEGLTPEAVLQIHNAFDAMELVSARSKSELLTLMGGEAQLQKSIQNQKLEETLGMTAAEIALVSHIFNKNGNALDLASGKETYRHIGDSVLELKEVQKLKAGDFYHHPVQEPHRLFVNPNILTATFILTAPPTPHQVPGELVRPGPRLSGDVRERQFYTPEQLKTDLQKVIDLIQQQEGA